MALQQKAVRNGLLLLLVLALAFLGHALLNTQPNSAAVPAGQNATPMPEHQQQEPVQMISVLVIGQVKNPGSYRLYIGSTVGDAIAMAGGLLDGADSSQLDMQKVIENGNVIHVPAL